MTEIHWQILQGQIGEVAYQLRRTQFLAFTQVRPWHPAVNAYRCRDAIAVCVDLAGVEQSRIDLQVERRRLRIRGHRPGPEPDRSQNEPLQVLAMEIDSGLFEREVVFPTDVDPDRASAEHRNGMLWIHLPLRAEG